MPKIDDDEDNLTAVGAYVFAGGFTIGVRAAGFDVLCHLEGDGGYGAPTAKLNFPDLPIHVGPEKWPIDELAGEVDFVYGNPPCAAWSQAGSANKGGKSWKDSSLVDCTRKHFNLLRSLRPRAWAWESVQRAWTLGREMVDDMARRASDVGYSTTVWLHDAANLGTPQRRRRFFMVCHSVELEFPDRFDRHETVEEALERIALRGDEDDVPLESFLRSVSPKIVQKMLPGENLRGAWERLTPIEQRELNSRGQPRGRPSFSYVRPHPNRPSPVIRQETVHPTEPRGMSLRELRVLCGFPDWFKIRDRTPAYLLGRGVCPPVGEHLANVVRIGLSKNRVVRAPTYRLIDQTGDETNTQTFTY